MATISSLSCAFGRLKPGPKCGSGCGLGKGRMGKLTVKGIESIIKTGAPGKTGDGDGLYLQINRAGVPSWIFRYKFSGKSREMGLGRFPVVSLAEARLLAADQKRLLIKGTDPLAVRDAERAAEKEALGKANAVSFRSLAIEYREAQGSGWSEKWFRNWLRDLEKYAFPLIGNLPPQAIETSHVVGLLKPIWEKITRTADDIRGRIEQVLDYAKAHGYRDGENPARWRGHLENLLSKAAKKEARKREHYPSMNWSNVPELMEKLALKASQSKGLKGCVSRDVAATRLLIITGVRSHMVRFAAWANVDFEAKTWRIPADKMKRRLAFDVPLPPAAISLLKAIPRLPSNPWVFPGDGDKSPVMHANAMRNILHGMGHSEITRHGFRSSFRNWSSECTNHPREVCEMVLAHDERKATERAYHHSDYLEKRRVLMTEWAAYVTSRQDRAVPQVAASSIEVVA